MQTPEDIVWKVWPLTIGVLVAINSAKLYSQNKPIFLEETVRTQSLAMFQAVCILLLLLFVSLFVVSLFDDVAKRPNRYSAKAALA